MRNRLAGSFPTLAVIAVAVISLHVVDDAWIDAPPEASAGHGLLLGLPAIILAAAALALAVRAPAPGRVFLAFVVGAVLIVDAGVHVVHASDSGVGASDLTGFLVGLAGVALVIVAFATTLRPKRRRSAARRWGARLGAVAAFFAGILLVLFPVSIPLYTAHKPAMIVPQASLPAGHRDFSVRTSDGLKLAASYIAPRNGRVIIVLHGSGGDRGGGPVSRAKMLARNGYGVLMYDARGSGESSGRAENLGWTWPRDVKAVVDWLSRRKEVKAIGALGLSTGAEVMLDSAAHDKRIRAVVAEGTQGRSRREIRLMPGGLQKLYLLEQFSVVDPLYRAFTHAPKPESLGDLVPRIAPRLVLLISARDAYEREMNRAYKRLGGGSVQLWETDGPHTGALKKYPREYERRVVHFFDDAFGT